MAGYTRLAFGEGWADTDRDGCNTRAEILLRDLTNIQVRHTPTCLVLSGHYVDPYTGVSADVDAGTLDIDHVVALADAWRSGAATWTAARRRALANDPEELLAVSASGNRSKGDSGPGSWQPPDRADRCRYGRIYETVKAKWSLTVTPSDAAALTADLASCPAAR